MSAVHVVRPGYFTTVQDLGRRGLSHLGVSGSGALDRRSSGLANRLVGNARSAAVLETTLGGLVLRAEGAVYVSITGAQVPISVDGSARGMNAAFRVRPGQAVELGDAVTGLRSYVAVRGGIALPPVLGSRARDVMSGLGPEPLRAGAVLPIGGEHGEFPPVDCAPVARRGAEEVLVDYTPGPRDDWFRPDAVGLLGTSRWTVDVASNRIGVRLNGPTLARAVTGELPSEGMPLGAIQVPPAGPIVFLNDHPVTGGYPVIGVVRRAHLDDLAQLRPGQTVRFRSA